MRTVALIFFIFSTVLSGCTSFSRDTPTIIRLNERLTNLENACEEDLEAYYRKHKMDLYRESLENAYRPYGTRSRLPSSISPSPRKSSPPLSTNGLNQKQIDLIQLLLKSLEEQ